MVILTNSQSLVGYLLIIMCIREDILVFSDIGSPWAGAVPWILYTNSHALPVMPNIGAGHLDNCSISSPVTSYIITDSTGLLPRLGLG